MKFFRQCGLIAMLLGLVMPAALLADGFIIPMPGINMAVKYHHVTVTIQSQAAHTEIDQVFLNDTDIDSVEAWYVFPMPEGATFDHFTMYVDGVPLAAEVLDADSARNYYESIVRTRRDPALLEYIGTNLFRARIWPINARGEKRVVISYDEILSYENGLIRYLYPLSTEKFSYKPLESVTISVNVTSPDPIKSVYSPSHTIVVQKSDDFHAQAVYDDENVTPNTDFVLYYTVSPDDVGMHVMAYREAGEDGFYMLLAAPKVDVDEGAVIRKRMIFVLDRSGSMSGDKIIQVKNALEFCINNLNDGDWFNIIDFSSEVDRFKNGPVAANAGIRAEALTYVQAVNAMGGTNINEALLTGLGNMKSDTLANMIIFLTDGQPTVGETNDSRILANILSANTRNARIFVFGVGYDVNTVLLDQLADQNNGVSVYVGPGEDIEIAVSNFYQKISAPVLSGCGLDFSPIQVSRQFPAALPDLFQGSQIVQLGRYETMGSANVVLSGTANGGILQFSHQADFPEDDRVYDFIPRLWAIRKVGDLLNQIRLIGENQELIDELIEVAKRYGIITPYTSFLIAEDVVPTGNFEGIGDKTGGVAYDNAVGIGNWRNADNTNATSSGGVKYVGNKTFFMRDSVWIDVQYDSTAGVRVLTFGSPEYFQILKDNPGLGDVFAVGNNVQTTWNGSNYQVGLSSGVNGGEKPTPSHFQLYQNIPNPFNQSTTIRFELTEKSPVSLTVFNIMGQKIRTLHQGVKSQGPHSITWDGMDDRGMTTVSGVYFVRMEAKNETQMKKMVLVR